MTYHNLQTAYDNEDPEDYEFQDVKACKYCGERGCRAPECQEQVEKESTE